MLFYAKKFLLLPWLPERHLGNAGATFVPRFANRILVADDEKSKASASSSTLVVYLTNMIANILVVCTGNICRSPIGEGLLKAKAPQCNVLSAGTGALVGHPADPFSIEVMAEKGFDITSHRAQQLTKVLLSSVDLVLTLDRHHGDWINGRYPEYRGKVHKLLRWRENADVPDPHRLPRAAFDDAYVLIEKGVDDWLKRL